MGSFGIVACMEEGTIAQVKATPAALLRGDIFIF